LGVGIPTPILKIQIPRGFDKVHVGVLIKILDNNTQSEVKCSTQLALSIALIHRTFRGTSSHEYVTSRAITEGKWRVARAISEEASTFQCHKNEPSRGMTFGWTIPRQSRRKSRCACVRNKQRKTEGLGRRPDHEMSPGGVPTLRNVRVRRGLTITCLGSEKYVGHCLNNV